MRGRRRSGRRNARNSLRDFLKSELERWGKVIRDKNIKEGS